MAELEILVYGQLFNAISSELLFDYNLILGQHTEMGSLISTLPFVLLMLKL